MLKAKMEAAESGSTDEGQMKYCAYMYSFQTGVITHFWIGVCLFLPQSLLTKKCIFGQKIFFDMIHFSNLLHQHSEKKVIYKHKRNCTFKVLKIILKSMSLTKGYSLHVHVAIVPGSLILWWFLILLVFPENKRKFIVFSFRPVDSIVFFKLK